MFEFGVVSLSNVKWCGTWDWCFYVTVSRCLQEKTRFPNLHHKRHLLLQMKFSQFVSGQRWENFFQTTSLRKYIYIYMKSNPDNNKFIYFRFFFGRNFFWNVTCLKRAHFHIFWGSRWWLSHVKPTHFLQMGVKIKTCLKPPPTLSCYIAIR